MAGTVKRRTQVEALDDLAAAMRQVAREQRTANLLTVLSLGVGALEHDEGKNAKSELAIARTEYRNALRAEVREQLEGGE